MKLLNRILSIVVTAAMLFTAVPVFASNEQIETDVVTFSNSFPHPSSDKAMYVDGTWRTIATSTSGFNCNVRIEGTVLSDYMDVRMLGKNGNVLWSESNAFSTYGTGYRIFRCGSDVYSIQVRCNANGIAWAYRTSSSPT